MSVLANTGLQYLYLEALSKEIGLIVVNLKKKEDTHINNFYYYLKYVYYIPGLC